MIELREGGRVLRLSVVPFLTTAFDDADVVWRVEVEEAGGTFRLEEPGKVSACEDAAAALRASAGLAGLDLEPVDGVRLRGTGGRLELVVARSPEPFVFPLVGPAIEDFATRLELEALRVYRAMFEAVKCVFLRFDILPAVSSLRPPVTEGCAEPLRRRLLRFREGLADRDALAFDGLCRELGAPGYVDEGRPR